MAPKQSKKWVVVVNNWTAEMLAALKAFPDITFGIFGEEVGESGTPHLQGYIELEKRTRTATLQKKLGKAGIKCTVLYANGTPEQNITYCSKDGTVHTWGEVAGGAGTRNDLIHMKEIIDAGATNKEVRDAHPGNWYRMRNSIEAHRYEVASQKNDAELREEMEDITLRGWQEEVLTDLKEQGDRKVMWIVDYEGGSGKSFLAKYLFSIESAFTVTSGRTADIAFAYQKQAIVVFDFTRVKTGQSTRGEK